MFFYWVERPGVFLYVWMCIYYCTMFGWTKWVLIFSAWHFTCDRFAVCNTRYVFEFTGCHTRFSSVLRVLKKTFLDSVQQHSGWIPHMPPKKKVVLMQQLDGKTLFDFCTSTFKFIQDCLDFLPSPSVLNISGDLGARLCKQLVSLHTGGLGTLCSSHHWQIIFYLFRFLVQWTAAMHILSRLQMVFTWLCKFLYVSVCVNKRVCVCVIICMGWWLSHTW